MSKSNYNKDLYKMYEEELTEKELVIEKYKHLKLNFDVMASDFNNLKNTFNDKIRLEREKAKIPLISDNNNLRAELKKAYEEIDRLKKELNKKDYNIDKLECSVNKNSTNSGIPTSKEIRKPIDNKSSANTYNHRQKTGRKTGGQLGHKGKTLTKEKLLEKMKANNIKSKKITHYIKGDANQADTVKYKIGMSVELYVEEHVFKHIPNTKKVLPKEYYSDVTYNDDLKSLIVIFGNYYLLGYKKINEILSDLSNGIINISEGTIDNIYEEFSNKCEGTINNITNNLLNGTFEHTDETTTKQNGKDMYYRGYANPLNVLYKYHDHKGDKPIEEDNILPRYLGTIISDHEVGIFKYGKNNQDCVIHTGRYCIRAEQNVIETCWEMRLYNFLLKLERERKILSKFGKTSFTNDEIKKIEDEYDLILESGEEQNKEISSRFWKNTENTFLRRLKKYKNQTLFFIHDFTLPYDNNMMERLLRMIKQKTKLSGGFRSTKGGERFGTTMSIIKTSKLRNLNPLSCIKNIYKGKELFA